MKIHINRRTGDINIVPQASYASGKLYAFGHVDRIHTDQGAPWFPTWEEVEKVIAGWRPGTLSQHTIQIEGEFLILYKQAGKISIFCDRYAMFPVYYRLTPTTLQLFDTIPGEMPNLAIKQSEALAFLLFKYLIGRRTLFDGIFRLMPGECLILDTKSGNYHTETACVYPKVEQERLSDIEAGQRFHALLQESLDAHIQPLPTGEKLILPLSGGFDSTYLLATTLELVSPHRILTMTFGAPGTYDFEIGQAVARAMGVRNIAYPLSPANYRDESLILNSMDTNAEVSFSTETPLEVYASLAEYGQTILSGNPGGTPLGQKFRPETTADHRLIALGDIIIKPQEMLSRYLDQEIIEDSFYFLDGGLQTPLGLSELWYFVNHIPRYAVPCVYKLREHFNYISAFADYALNDYATNQPAEKRYHQRLYKFWIQHHFPKLAALPSRFYHGAPLSSGWARKFTAKQWDRFLLHILKIDKRAVKIDWRRHYSELLDAQNLDNFASQVFSPAVRDLIFQTARSRIMLLYGLKSLKLLQTYWDVEFYREERQEKAMQPVMGAL